MQASHERGQAGKPAPHGVDQSDRRKFRTSCFCEEESELKFATVELASEPELACCEIAVSRFDVRPSCRKKIRCPRPHRGALRN